MSDGRARARAAAPVNPAHAGIQIGVGGIQCSYMYHTPDEPDLPLDSAERVRDDLPCGACGYNLRTLPAVGVCPECGAPVFNSLIRADQRRRRMHMRRGLSLVLLSLLILLCGWLAQAAVLVALSAGTGPNMATAVEAMLVVRLTYPLLIALFGLPLVIGLLMVTVPDRSVSGREGISLRRMLRVSAVLLSVPLVCGGLLVAAIPLGTWEPRVEQIAVAGGAAACFVVPILLMLYLRLTLSPEHCRSLRRQLMNEATAIGLCSLFVVGGLLMRNLASASVPRGSPAAQMAQIIGPRLRTTPYSGGVVAPRLPEDALSTQRSPIAYVAATFEAVGRWGGLIVAVAGVALLLSVRRALARGWPKAIPSGPP